MFDCWVFCGALDCMNCCWQFASTPRRWVQSHFGWYWPHGGSLPWDVSQAWHKPKTCTACSIVTIACVLGAYLQCLHLTSIYVSMFSRFTTLNISLMKNPPVFGDFCWKFWFNLFHLNSRWGQRTVWGWRLTWIRCPHKSSREMLTERRQNWRLLKKRQQGK